MSLCTAQQKIKLLEKLGSLITGSNGEPPINLTFSQIPFPNPPSISRASKLNSTTISSSSVSSTGAAPLTPNLRMCPSMEDSHTTYADQSSSSSSSTVSPMPVHPKPSTSSEDIPTDADRFLSYLQSLRLKERSSLNLYNVSLSDLSEASMIYPPLLENHNALFLEALNLADAAKTFIPVTCYFCSNFSTSSTDANAIHVSKKHIGILQPILLASFPRRAPDSWIRGNKKLEWFPLDATNFQPATSSKQRKRTELLARIEPVFEFLAAHGILTFMHFEALIKFAIEAVPAIPSRQSLLAATFKQSNVCIRVLGPPQLEIALRFLEALKACGININYADSAFEETQHEEKYQLFLNPGEVLINLKKYGSRPHDLVRWLYDSSDEVSPSSWNDAVQSREHKIMQLVRMYLQVVFQLGRACYMKLRRLAHFKAINHFRYLSIEVLQERLYKGDSIEKTAINQILEVARNLQESNHENSNVQDVINKKIIQLHLQCLLCDARILSGTKYLNKLGSKIGKISKLDYRIVIAPLIKRIIKKRLYNLLEQNVRYQAESEGEAHNFEPSDQLYAKRRSGVSNVQEPPKIIGD